MTRPAHSATQYVTLAQASGITNLSIKTLRRAINAGRLPIFRMGRLVRLDLDDVHRFMRGGGLSTTDARAPNAQPNSER
jgi:excisionase family DNA binding protein